MKQIGITGGIGSGKSTVCKVFEALNIPVFYADDAGKFLLNNLPELIEKVKTYFGDDIYYNFNHLSKKLQVLEPFEGAAALHYQYEYIVPEAAQGQPETEDMVFNHEWIKAYSTAKTKMLWGTVTGKYDQALVGGARINYGDMKSEASEEIQRLDEELLTKWSDPAPIDVA